MDKNLLYYVKSYQLLDKKTCKKIIKKIENIDWQKHTFYDVTENRLIDRSGDKELDIARVVDDGDEIKNLVMQKIWEAYFNYTKDLQFTWFNSWQGYTEVRFNRYKETRLMAEHCDHIHSIFDGQRKGIPTMTALGLLNEDFQGGEFVMFQDTVIPFKMGEIKIFPSCFLFPHRIDPVTKGTRFSFVSWAW